MAGNLLATLRAKTFANLLREKFSISTGKCAYIELLCCSP